MRRSTVIGLVGGIGSGKSEVAAIFVKFGARCVDADALAHRVINQPPVQRELVRWWGPGILRRGRVDRKEVARRVFGSPAQVKRLNALLHPRIGRLLRERIAATKKSGGLLVVDAPLLLEVGLDRRCDVLIYVDAPRALRLKRAVSRGWTRGDFDRRESAQWPVARKKSRAEHVIDNKGSLAVTVKQVRTIVRTLTEHPREI